MYNSYMYEEDDRINYPRVGEIILYTVNKGDNVFRLAKTFNSDVSWIQLMNGLNEDNMIQTNQQLLIPVMFRRPPMPPHQHQRQSYDLYF